jgi:hypothetical protein
MGRKWQELTILVNRYYSKYTAREILTRANFLVSKGKYNWVEVDEKLVVLHNIDKRLSCLS